MHAFGNTHRLRGNAMRWIAVLLLIVGFLGMSSSGQAADAKEKPWRITQQIRYHSDEAGEVYIVWGVGGWKSVPKSQRPPGTRILDGIMHSPMRKVGDAFAIDLHVAADTEIKYLFHLTEKRSGVGVDVWDNGPEKGYRTVAMLNAPVDVTSTVSLANAEELPGMGQVGVWLLLGMAGFIVLVGTILILPRDTSRSTVLWVLIALSVVAVSLRTAAAWNKNANSPDTVERLSGDETGYEYLASELLEGRFFEWPGRAPVYPLFLAGCYVVFGHSYAIVLYVQAVVASAAVPLTYLLARRYTRPRAALFASGVVALHPGLIIQVTRMYTEAVYTPLILVTVLALLWAIDVPRLRRVVFAGAIMAIATLFRPTTLLFPAAVPFLLPWSWNLKRRFGFTAIYFVAMALVIAPWTYHNYRTHHAFLPVAVSTAVLWQGSPECYHLMIEQHVSIAKLWKTEMSEEKNEGHDPYSIKGDRYFSQRAKDSICAEPFVYAWFCVLKVFFFWFGHPANDWRQYAMFDFSAFLPYLPPWQIAGTAISRTIPAIAIVALIILRRRILDFLPLLVVLGYFVGLCALTFAALRYSEPLHPILLAIIATAASQVWSGWSSTPKTAAQAVESRDGETFYTALATHWQLRAESSRTRQR
jgi:4-amino-4-deoxy-L-arabinose transferase-like glycosyltransferase